MEMLTREAFLHTDSTGSGYGNCYGSGSGSGYGYDPGYGYGYSECSGDCYGDGSGDGSGSGNGFGYEFGFGYGYDSGSGFGTSSSYCIGFDCNHGLKSLNGHPVDMIDDVPTILTRIIGNVAKGFIVGIDLSLAATFVCKQGNTFAHGETLHKAREALLEKLFNHMTTEERIEAFCAEFEPGVKRPAMDFFSWHHRLTGSCEQGRREFARQHDVDIESDALTPEEFFALTRYSYGGKIIRQTERRFASISKD